MKLKKVMCKVQKANFEKMAKKQKCTKKCGILATFATTRNRIFIKCFRETLQPNQTILLLHRITVFRIFFYLNNNRAPNFVPKKLISPEKNARGSRPTGDHESLKQLKKVISNNVKRLGNKAARVT